MWHHNTTEFEQQFLSLQVKEGPNFSHDLLHNKSLTLQLCLFFFLESIIDHYLTAIQFWKNITFPVDFVTFRQAEPSKCAESTAQKI